MYTGIVLGTEQVCSMTEQQGYRTIWLSNQHGFMDDVFIGASVAVDGTCLTVTQIQPSPSQIAFDISDQTLSLTSLKDLNIGDQVNIERSFKMGMENGGHNLYGHIEGTVQVIALSYLGETLHLELAVPTEKMKYLFHKGFIGLHGCSLTINQIDPTRSSIAVDLIPETLRLTNFKTLQLGAKLNYEIDQHTRVLVDTLEAIHQRQNK
ncbi:riboflavin synthase [Acinetobacter larvae]|uniref:Riboflavin synthase n=1 Tax=Acinetobacter larvae TaxID=1789224 RepID=A0A1B2M1M8_9GAMM|nr:riboflavin synthase [Acinetobacter larvae]AOA59094.1 riboflavin synthase subunit alpha [Acinetobacter larvae]